MNLDLTRRTFQLELGGTTHELRELTGAERDAYVTELLAGAKVGADGKLDSQPKINKVAFVAASLYDAPQAFGGKKVPRETIAQWPARVVEFLYAKADELNALTEGEATKAGND